MRALAALAALALAGCLAPAAVPEEAAAASAAPPAGALAWSGRYVVGAAYEAPAHFRETAALVAPLWRTMAVFHAEAAPTELVVWMNWTGLGRLQLMVSTPDEAEAPVDFATPGPNEFTDAKSLCLRVPAEALQPGGWLVMPHSLATADVAFTIEARAAHTTLALDESHDPYPTYGYFAEGVPIERGEAC